MIRRVFRLNRGMMMDCFYVANQFVDAQNIISWQNLEFNVELEKSIMFVDETSSGFLKGFLLGSSQPDGALIDSLFVDKKFQHQGVGGALLCAYEDWARRCGAKQIKLQSRPTKQALGFYQKYGFVKTSLEYHMQKSL